VPIISGGGDGIRVASVTLTNAQILALPTTPVVVIPATQTPNYGTDLTAAPIVVGGYVLLSNYVAAYTNVDPTAALGLTMGSDLGSGIGMVGGLLAPASLLESGDAFLRIIGADYEPTNTFPALAPHVFAFTHNYFDNAIVVYIDNAAAGNLTGGNVANKMVIRLLYVTAPIPTVN